MPVHVVGAYDVKIPVLALVPHLAHHELRPAVVILDDAQRIGVGRGQELFDQRIVGNRDGNVPWHPMAVQEFVAVFQPAYQQPGPPTPELVIGLVVRHPNAQRPERVSISCVPAESTQKPSATNPWSSASRRALKAMTFLPLPR